MLSGFPKYTQNIIDQKRVTFDTSKVVLDLPEEAVITLKLEHRIGGYETVAEIDGIGEVDVGYYMGIGFMTNDPEMAQSNFKSVLEAIEAGKYSLQVSPRRRPKLIVK